MTDIQDRADVETLVNTFYGKAKIDPILLPVFSKLSDEDWSRHLPRMYAFWDNWLFQTGEYRGGMMMVHLEVNERTPLHDPMFERWLEIFNETVDSLFVGERADFVKEKAELNRHIMGSKISFINQQKV
jgi:hemoglobin